MRQRFAIARPLKRDLEPRKGKGIGRGRRPPSLILPRTDFGWLEPQHIKAKPEDIAEKAVISGDPERVTHLSTLLEHPRLVSDNRGFLTYTGEHGGERLTIACHGVGGPSAAIVIEELAMLGAKAIIRLGSCGGLLKPMRVGDLVIATRAGYRSGTLSQYFGKRITPKPDGVLTGLLEDSARRRRAECYQGPVFSSDAFYAEEEDFVKKCSRQGYIAIEMECATLFGLGKLRKVMTASLLIVSNNITMSGPMVEAHALRRQAINAGEIAFTALNGVHI